MSNETEPLWCRIYRQQVIKPAQRQRQTEQKGRTEASRAGFYNLPAWKLLRQRRIIQNPICQRCESKGKINAAKVVDHIKPVEDYPELCLVFDNTQSLCDYCHGIKTRADAWERRRREKLRAGNLLKQKLEMEIKDPGGVLLKNTTIGKPQDREYNVYFQEEKPRGGQTTPFFVTGGGEWRK